MFSNNIDGAAINAGSGPCATAHISCPFSSAKFPTSGIKGKPVYIYSGGLDFIVPQQLVSRTADWFEK